MSSAAVVDVALDWRPQVKQGELLQAAGLLGWFLYGDRPTRPVADAIGYGGAAGGGKSDGLLALAFATALAYPGSHTALFRRTYPELEGADGAIERSQALWSGIAEYNAGQHVWRFPGGSSVRFCHCAAEADVYQYHGHQFDLLLLDESTRFSVRQKRYLGTRVRATVEGVKPLIVEGTNPGGPSHTDFRRLYADLDPFTLTQVEVEGVEGRPVRRQHIFIPAMLEDNDALMARDPEYEDRLFAAGPVVGRQLRYGDWSVYEGQFFPEWVDRPGWPESHVVRAAEWLEEVGGSIPRHWRHYGSMDWGYQTTVAAHHWVQDPSGRIVCVGEIEDTQQLEEALAPRLLEWGTSIPRYAGPDVFSQRKRDTGQTVGESFARLNCPFVPAGLVDRAQGWMRCHNWLRLAPDGRPWLLVLDTCKGLRRQLPDMMSDPADPEDVLDGTGQHHPDSMRYLLASRPLPAPELMEQVPSRSAEGLLREIERDKRRRRVTA